jgi:putative acetyltransferase
MIRIIDFENRYEDGFRQLNRDWLEQYDLMESHDLMVLDDPQGTILANGGCIYLAISADEKIIGSAALMKGLEGEYELAKMAVSPGFQGRGISKLLLEKCIQKAKDLGARKIMLYSNSRLEKALNLYCKYGFRHISVTNSPFVTADVKMELQF